MVQAILRSSASQVKPIIFRTFLNRWPTCHKGALSWWITTFNWWFLAKATIASLPAKVPGFAKLATAWKQERKMKSLRWKMKMQTWLVFTYCKQREARTHISKATDRKSRESEVNNMQTVSEVLVIREGSANYFLQKCCVLPICMAAWQARHVHNRAWQQLTLMDATCMCQAVPVISQKSSLLIIRAVLGRIITLATREMNAGGGVKIANNGQGHRAWTWWAKLSSQQLTSQPWHCHSALKKTIIRIIWTMVTTRCFRRGLIWSLLQAPAKYLPIFWTFQRRRRLCLSWWTLVYSC